MILEKNGVGMLGDRAALRELGVRLRDSRLRRNVTQRDVAEAMGVSLPTYRKLEQGDGTVPVRHLAKALALFGTVDRLPDVIVPYAVTDGQYRAQRRKRARRDSAGRSAGLDRAASVLEFDGRETALSFKGSGRET